MKVKEPQPQKRKYLHRFLALAAFTDSNEQIKHWLTLHEQNSSYNRLIDRLKVNAVLADKEHANKNSSFVIFYKAVQTEFKPGEVLTSSEIDNRLQKCLKLDPSLSDPNKDQATRLTYSLKQIRMFFDLDKKRIRRAGKLCYYYTVVPLTLDFILTTISTKGTNIKEKELYQASWDE